MKINYIFSHCRIKYNCKLFASSFDLPSLYLQLNCTLIHFIPNNIHPNPAKINNPPQQHYQILHPLSCNVRKTPHFLLPRHIHAPPKTRLPTPEGREFREIDGRNLMRLLLPILRLALEEKKARAPGWKVLSLSTSLAREGRGGTGARPGHVDSPRARGCEPPSLE